MKLYTIAEAAEETRMSQAWWRKKIFQKDIRYLRIGRRVFIPQSTIEEILNKAIVEPRSEPNKSSLDINGETLGNPQKMDRKERGQEDDRQKINTYTQGEIKCPLSQPRS